VNWPDIYARLKHDSEDARAWDALESNVRGWARPELWQHGWHVVDDVVADTCSTVVLSLGRARGGETFSKFAYGHFLNVRRRVLSARRPQFSLDGVDPPAPTEGADGDERLGVLRACLETLPSRERQALELRYFEECSSKQIAVALGVTIGNARRIVFNGLAHLRQCVGRSSSPVVGQAELTRPEERESAPAH
jgi:RNA polymerase sigma factor (sigma-70 family)